MFTKEEKETQHYNRLEDSLQYDQRDSLLFHRSIHWKNHNTVNSRSTFLNSFVIYSAYVIELVSLVRRARVYFSADSAKEILEELVPLISPHDSIAFSALGLISVFLPTHSTHYTPQLVSQFLSMWTWIGTHYAMYT